MVSTTSCSDWIDHIPLEWLADDIGDKIASAWSWLGEDSELPDMYTARQANVPYCRVPPEDVLRTQI